MDSARGTAHVHDTVSYGFKRRTVGRRRGWKSRRRYFRKGRRRRPETPVRDDVQTTVHISGTSGLIRPERSASRIWTVFFFAKSGKQRETTGHRLFRPVFFCFRKRKTPFTVFRCVFRRFDATRSRRIIYTSFFIYFRRVSFTKIIKYTFRRVYIKNNLV